MFIVYLQRNIIYLINISNLKKKQFLINYDILYIL